MTKAKVVSLLVDLAAGAGWVTMTIGLARTWRGYAISAGAFLVCWALFMTLAAAVRGRSQNTGGGTPDIGGG